MNLKVYYIRHKQFIVSYDVVGIIKWITVIEYKAGKKSLKNYNRVKEMPRLYRQQFITARAIQEYRSKNVWRTKCH